MAISKPIVSSRRTVSATINRRRQSKSASSNKTAAAVTTSTSTATAKGKRNERFSVENLFDYINESAASLAKVVSAHNEDSESEASQDGRQLSVRASIKNKKGLRVRFHSEVNVYPLEDDDRNVGARRGLWSRAPKHDELWDGSKKEFHEEEMTPEELETWLKGERKTNIEKFQDMLRPLFWSSSKTSNTDDEEEEEADNKSKRSSKEKKKKGENDEDDSEELEIQIELVETNPDIKDIPSLDMEEEEEEKGGKKKKKNKHGWRWTFKNKDHSFSSNKALQDRFEFTVKDKESDALLKQNVLGQKLSKSQAAAAASAGKVLMLQSTTGKTFGAAVKRRLKVKTKGKTSRKQKVNKKLQESRKKLRDIRTKDTGLNMRPGYIVLFFIFPLILIGIDDMWPYFEHFYFILTHPNASVRYEAPRKLEIPFWLHLLYPKLSQERWLRDTYKIGSYLIELSGLIVVLQLMYSWLIVFRAVRQQVKVRVNERYSIATVPSELDLVRRGSVSSEDIDGDGQYAYLFKWQQPSSSSSKKPVQQQRKLEDMDNYLDDLGEDDFVFDHKEERRTAEERTRVPSI